MAKAALRERFTRQWLSLRGVALVSLVAIAVLCAACLSVLFQSRLELVGRADIMAQNIFRLADQTVQLEVRRYDLRLLDVVADLHDSTTGAIGLPLDTSFFGGTALRKSIGDIIVLGSHGQVLASSRPHLTALYAAALPSIVAQSQPTPSGLSFSTVLLSGDNQPLIALTRLCPPGSCGQASAVVAMLPMSWIQSVFSGLVLGRNGAIALTDSSGTLLARQPVLAGSVGHLLETRSVIARIPPTGAVTYRKGSLGGRRWSRETAGRVGDLPLLVFVSISRAEILHGWVLLAFVIILAVVVLSGGLVALTLLLAREVHRTMKIDQQLLSANTLLAELARTDGLTGLLNRRGFDESLTREWRRCQRNARPIGLLMLDADRFKAYNDRFGHQAGDGVLRALGACIEANIRRPGDIAARYGGEEFAVILPDTDLVGAAQVAETIRAAVEALAMPHAGAGMIVTLSVGASVAPPGTTEPAEHLIATADAALYESKATGRNRVTIRTSTPPPAGEPAQA